MAYKKKLTTSAGQTVAEDNHSISVGSRGALTFDNYQLFEKLAHFNRERIPERVVHARGTGAYGIFKLTTSLENYTCADFLQDVGTETEVFVRFSTVGGGQDSSDYARDPRGFAVKFYTKEGNFDLVGNNTPVFFLRDGIKFPDFIHSQKKDPQTNLPNPAKAYEFWAYNPQSLHQVTILMSDRGIPFSYRHMHGFGSHTLSFYNKKKVRYWVKWHLKTNQGIKTLTDREAAKMPPFGAQQDLIHAITNGDFPSWTVKLQIMSEAQAKTYHINPFDLTKIWPHKDYPLMEIGTLTLNRNVKNYFAEVEQACFAPSNFVTGIAASPDKMLQARMLAYQDAHRYRVGVNANELGVNRPRCPVHNYQRDGKMVGDTALNDLESNQNETLNFYPNDNEHTPKPDANVSEPPMPTLGEVWVKPYNDADEDNFSQAGALFRLMNENKKSELAQNIATGLSLASKNIKKIMLLQFEKADPLYRKMVEEYLE